MPRFAAIARLSSALCADERAVLKNVAVDLLMITRPHHHAGRFDGAAFAEQGTAAENRIARANYGAVDHIDAPIRL